MPTHCANVMTLVGAIVLGGLLFEDGATITAVALTVSSALEPRIAFFSAFVGLWIGDLGVYALARSIGPSLVKRSWFQKWFGSKSGLRKPGSDGCLLLALSRFVPGTRVAAYISAAARLMPAAVFAGITGLSAFLWVILVFATIQLVPTRMVVALLHLPGIGVLGLMFLVALQVWRKREVQIQQAMDRGWDQMQTWASDTLRRLVRFRRGLPKVTRPSVTLS